ncbi:hypothetical protein DAMNIGENAA_24320 [Desulforhabdus amnigena]|uniref:Uncharacterized protein n=1 Tax=Desulforhabdus amnigena TaxID=40218 RepID=A0A9W6FUA8_9BACT|nr:hypothetical protein DAMNIGENAA_24320 [Desulforhabdus amnigena]
MYGAALIEALVDHFPVEDEHDVLVAPSGNRIVDPFNNGRDRQQLIQQIITISEHESALPPVFRLVEGEAGFADIDWNPVALAGGMSVFGITMDMGILTSTAVLLVAVAGWIYPRIAI